MRASEGASGELRLASLGLPHCGELDAVLARTELRPDSGGLRVQIKKTGKIPARLRASEGSARPGVPRSPAGGQLRPDSLLDCGELDAGLARTELRPDGARGGRRADRVRGDKARAREGLAREDTDTALRPAPETARASARPRPRRAFWTSFAGRFWVSRRTVCGGGGLWFRAKPSTQPLYHKP